MVVVVYRKAMDHPRVNPRKLNQTHPCMKPVSFGSDPLTADDIDDLVQVMHAHQNMIVNGVFPYDAPEYRVVIPYAMLYEDIPDVHLPARRDWEIDLRRILATDGEAL